MRKPALRAIAAPAPPPTARALRSIPFLNIHQPAQPIRIQPMSTGHRRNARKTDAELYQMLGEGDTSALYAKKVALDTAHDIPYAGGMSVDGKIVYIDRRLYRDVIDGRLAVRGMSPRQIIQAW